MTDPQYQPDQYVTLRAKVIEARGGELGYLVELFSKTDQYQAWVRPDMVTGPADPPPVDEPKGLGAVVKDRWGGLHIRTDYDAHTHEPWRAAGTDDTARWSDIAVVEVLQDGVE